MFKTLDLFLLSCFFLPAELQTSEILNPQNVSLQWISDFEPQVSWEPPQHWEEHCSYRVEIKEDTYHYDNKRPLTWKEFTPMNGGNFSLSVQTMCNNSQSEKVYITVSDAELVSNLQCYIYSAWARCSWHSETPDVRFFYQLADQDSGHISVLKECSLYSYNENNITSGCDFQATLNDVAYIVFNGTMNNRLNRNTYEKRLISDVRPAPLNWTIYKLKDAINISWMPPDFAKLSSWKFKINFTQCGDRNMSYEPRPTETSFRVTRSPQCPFCVSVGAFFNSKPNRAGYQWSEPKCLEADEDGNVLVYIAVFIPMMFATVAALTCVCCRKNKENLFPKIPEPRDFLTDISDNNNKSSVHNLYIPAEEEDCEITLVIDPQNHKLDS